MSVKQGSGPRRERTRTWKRRGCDSRGKGLEDRRDRDGARGR